MYNAALCTVFSHCMPLAILSRCSLSEFRTSPHRPDARPVKQPVHCGPKWLSSLPPAPFPQAPYPEEPPFAAPPTPTDAMTDPVAARAGAMMSHMNKDHEVSMVGQNRRCLMHGD